MIKIKKIYISQNQNNLFKGNPSAVQPLWKSMQESLKNYGISNSEMGDHNGISIRTMGKETMQRRLS